MNDGERDREAVNTRMAELVRKFVARTGDDIAQMRAGLARLDAGDPSGLAQIHQLAHRACGTGGTLGLTGLSDAAGDLERRVEACQPGAMPPQPEIARIAADIDRFAAQLELL